MVLLGFAWFYPVSSLVSLGFPRFSVFSLLSLGVPWFPMVSIGGQTEDHAIAIRVRACSAVHAVQCVRASTLA